MADIVIPSKTSGQSGRFSLSISENFTWIGEGEREEREKEREREAENVSINTLFLSPLR